MNRTPNEPNIMDAMLLAVRTTTSKRSRSECLTLSSAPSFWAAHRQAHEAYTTLSDMGGTQVGPIVVKVLSRAQFVELPMAAGFRDDVIPVVIDDGSGPIAYGFDYDTQDWATTEPTVMH